VKPKAKVAAKNVAAATSNQTIERSVRKPAAKGRRVAKQ
jgi:hypothetical protein